MTTDTLTDRACVVRYSSQHFTPQRCDNDDDRNRRIFDIRERIKWRITDVDYAVAVRCAAQEAADE